MARAPLYRGAGRALVRILDAACETRLGRGVWVHKEDVSALDLIERKGSILRCTAYILLGAKHRTAEDIGLLTRAAEPTST